MYKDVPTEKEKPALALQCQERAKNPIKDSLNSKKVYSRKPLTATFVLDGSKKTIKLKGRNAQALRALVDKGIKGITALEMSSWALRLGAYIHNIREMGLRDFIITERENHQYGWHGRYILIISITIIE
jgi:hypothetical protein